MRTSTHLQFVFLSYLAFSTTVAPVAGESGQKTDPERDRQIHELALECSESVWQAAKLPDEQSIPIYGNVLKRLGGWDRPDTLEVFRDAQQKLLSIPGHAAYYRDKINAAKDKLRSGEMTINDWDRMLADSFRTLQHMPSEETVEVLAGLGGDKFGHSWSKEPRDFKDVPVLHGLDEDLSTAGMGVIDIHAFHALDALGIEPPPYQNRAQVNEQDLEKIWGGWWQEVKTGKRKYRFKGSLVEHPINAPPGTGREARRPERHPSEMSTPVTERTPASAKIDPNQFSEPPRRSTRWPLYGLISGILVVAVGLIIYWRQAKSPER